MPDSDILAKARREERILLTHDLDFGDLMAASAAALPSVVVFRLRNMRPKNVSRYLRVIVDQHQGVLGQGAILSVTESQIRWRALPI